jgi:SnoaL-like domain
VATVPPVDASPATLVEVSLLEVFGERDAGARAAAAHRVFSPDVVFRDAEAEVVGIDGLLAKAEGLLGSAPPDWVFAADGSAEEIGDLARASWTFGPAGGPAQVRGTDIALVADGLINRLYTFVQPVVH